MESYKVKLKNGAKMIFSLVLVFLKIKVSAMSLSWVKHSLIIKI